MEERSLKVLPAETTFFNKISNTLDSRVFNCFGIKRDVLEENELFKFYYKLLTNKDNIEDYELIHRKLKLIRKYSRSSSIKFFVLVGFTSTDAEDIENMWKRVELLMRYQCLPYIMRYRDKNDTPWKKSKYRGMYGTMARWCNQPSFFKKKSFRQSSI